MKQADIVKVLHLEFGSQDPIELNKILKAKVSENIKFSLLGKRLGHLGFTVVIKNMTDEGLKIFDVGRVRLIKYADIERFERAKVKPPRVKRPKKASLVLQKKVGGKKSALQESSVKKIAEGDEAEELEPLFAKKRRKKSSFIPK